MNLQRILVTSLAALVGAAGLFALRAGGQPSPGGQDSPGAQPPANTRVVEVGPNDTLIEQTLDGRILRTTQQSPNEAARSSWTTADGR
ncbi:MAG: hypothetical protein L0211_19045, partial [Planctomycetaceae bacterium]|nr:hypothetical protein [Planctomycetaceae bacterium]